jgi:multidrug efflux system membrane fusion protein
MSLANYARSIATSLLGIGLIALAGAIIYPHIASMASPKLPVATPAPGPVSVVDGVTTIRLAPAIQAHNGIVVSPLLRRTARGEQAIYGTAFDLQPLVDVRTRYGLAAADAQATRAAAAASHDELGREKALYSDHQNVSLKVLQAAELAYSVDQIKADAAALALRDIESGARQQFGDTLAHWAMDRQSSAFERLLTRRDSIVRLTIPPGETAAPTSLEVQAASARITATLVSQAAKVDPGQVGSSYLYRVARPIAAGTAVIGYVAEPASPAQAVFVPAGAVIWHAGEPWLYVMQSASTFVRRPLHGSVETDGGYLVAQGLEPGERVVTQGAGQLLSEEQRPPPNGAGCKDPECD